MSDSIKHECGIAFIRLLKPLSFYQKKYGTALYGLNKLYLLMEKQHNRGQDGAGIATIKLDVKPGHRYISRYRSMAQNAVADIFGTTPPLAYLSASVFVVIVCSWVTLASPL